MLIDQLNTLLTIEEEQSNQYILSKYILGNIEKIGDYKLNELLFDIGVSKSTFSRFCQSLGYRNFTDLQYQIYHELMNKERYYNNITMIEDIQRNSHLIKDKKRIIVVGDSYSISPLLIYKHLFMQIGIEFIIKIKPSRPIQILEEYHVSKDDLIFYVSLYKTNLQILADIFVPYVEFVNYLKTKQIPFIYLGQIAAKNEIEDFLIEIKKKDIMSKNIEQLCFVFENIYYLLDKRQNEFKK